MTSCRALIGHLAHVAVEVLVGEVRLGVAGDVARPAVVVVLAVVPATCHVIIACREATCHTDNTHIPCMDSAE